MGGVLGILLPCNMQMQMAGWLATPMLCYAVLCCVRSLCTVQYCGQMNALYMDGVQYSTVE